MKIITEKFVFGGKSLGKIDGKNVFLPFAIPGEELEINITESKKDYDNGQIVKILKESPYRQEAPCKYYGKCGGCNMLHIKPDYQRELRKIILQDIFAQNGIDIKDKTQVIFGPEYNYRARFQLNEGGLSVYNSNLIVPIDNCLCAEKVINEYFAQTSMNDRPKGRTHLFASQFSEDKEKVLLAYSQKNDKVNIKIKDTGMGIAENELDKIFAKNYRSASAKNLSIPGSGLGLSIAKNFAEEYGGSIDVKSKIGEGTEFTVCFPEYNL